MLEHFRFRMPGSGARLQAANSTMSRSGFWYRVRDGHLFAALERRVAAKRVSNADYIEIVGVAATEAGLDGGRVCRCKLL